MDNKRGQEGITITTLLLIVLGVVVVVVIIIGATTGFDFIFGKFNILPGQSLETKVQSCIVAAKAEPKLVTSYCKEYVQVKVSGENQYVNCLSPDVANGIKAGGAEGLVNCDSSFGNKDALDLEQCKTLIFSGKNPSSTKVNGQFCSLVVKQCTDFASDVSSAGTGQCPDGTRTIEISGSKCCVLNKYFN